MHFARMVDGHKVPLPIFPGLKGPEIVRGLMEIEATFEKNLQILKNVKHVILDVKVTFVHIDGIFTKIFTKRPGFRLVEGFLLKIKHSTGRLL